MQSAVRVDGKTIVLVYAVRLSRMEIISNEINRCKIILTLTVRSSHSSLLQFEQNYIASLANACVLDIVDDIMSSNILAANSKAISARYIRVIKMTIRNKNVLLLVVSVVMDFQRSIP